MLGRAHPDRVEPVRALVERFDTHVYGEGWEEHGIASRGLIYGDDVLAALASATDHGDLLPHRRRPRPGQGGALRLRRRRRAGVHQPLRRGRALLHLRPRDRRLRLDGRSCSARSATTSTIPDEAAAVRAAGRARVLAEHTWTAVWPRILARLGKDVGEAAAVIRSGAPREIADGVAATGPAARGHPRGRRGPLPLAHGAGDPRAVPRHRRGPVRGPPGLSRPLLRPRQQRPLVRDRGGGRAGGGDRAL